MSNHLEVLRTCNFQEEIRRVKRDALPVQTSENLRKEDILATKGFLSGDIDLQSYRKGEVDVVDPGVLLVEGPDALKIVLTLLGFEDNAVDEEVRHEEKHWRTAKEFGFEAKMGVRLVRVENRAYFRNTLTSFKIPEAFSEETARQALHLIIMAPGEDMSPGDLARLPHLNQLG